MNKISMQKNVLVDVCKCQKKTNQICGELVNGWKGGSEVGRLVEMDG